MWHGSASQRKAQEYHDEESLNGDTTLRVVHIDMTPGLRGGPRQMIALANELRYLPSDDDIEQILVVRAGTPVAAACQSIDGVTVRPVGNSTILAARAAKDADVIHVHDEAGIAAAAILSHWGIPFIATRRSAIAPKMQFTTRWAYFRAARVIGVSDRVSSMMRAYRNNRYVGTIPDCAAIATGLEKGSGTRDSHRNFVVGCIGTIDFETKGQDLVVDAARILLGTCPQVDIVIVGDGPDAGRLRSLCADLSNVTVIDWQDDVEAQYRQIDALVQPSRVEAFGSTILEAMSTAVPVIATDVGGIPEILRNDVNGIMVERNSAVAIAGAITRLANDVSLARRLAASGKRTSSRFSAKRMAQEYYSEYLIVLASEQARRLTF